MPLIESAASGLPVITTNWSGHLEFLQKDCFYPVEYDLVELPASKIDGRIFVENTQWAEPRKKSFIDQIDKVYNNHKEAKDKAKKMKKDIVLNFNAAAINKKYEKVLQEVF